ncbi:ABC-2 type transporter [Gottschalkia purinilytica]|uniref:ABC-2 type transporter n=1 Tax=Gottschalkia purinilytica TaxID=1503 RepID=A0A0L0WA10_GOTPU|nr:ABC transporter permease [Gottschalkia purinilytica]KNF08306.1 ABC-2 type transporter [Gottschalkia purinilytica]
MVFYTLFKRDLINIVLNPVLFLSNTIFPFLLVLSLGYLMNGNYQGNEVTSYDYYGITMLIFTTLNVSMTSANSFMEKSLKNSNLRVLYSPIRISYVYLSKILATFVFTSICLLLLMIFSNIALGVNFGGAKVIYVIMMILSFNLLSCTIGVFFCCIFKGEELSNKILSIVNNILAILGGLFFRISGFGKLAEKLSSISYVKWILEGIFKVIYDQDISYFLPVTIVLLMLSAILMLGCKFVFRMEDYV